jgi:hypothetical protein
MKKLSAIFLTAALLLSLSLSAAADILVIQPLSTEGALLILRHTTGIITLPESDLRLFDLNKDGKVDTADALLALRAATGIITPESLNAAQRFVNEEVGFVISVYTDKKVYKTTDIIEIWASFWYGGSVGSSIEIFHSDPYITFSVKQGDVFHYSTGVSDVLLNTTLEAGELQEFYSTPELRLPAGEYTVTAYVDVSLSDENIRGTRTQFLTRLQITVEE